MFINSLLEEKEERKHLSHALKVLLESEEGMHYKGSKSSWVWYLMIFFLEADSLYAELKKHLHSVFTLFARSKRKDIKITLKK